MSGVVNAPAQAPANISGATNAAGRCGSPHRAYHRRRPRASGGALDGSRAVYAARVAAAGRCRRGVVIAARWCTRRDTGDRIAGCQSRSWFYRQSTSSSWTTALCADSVQRESSRLATTQCPHSSYPATASATIAASMPPRTKYEVRLTATSITPKSAAVASQRSAKTGLSTSLKPSWRGSMIALFMNLTAEPRTPHGPKAYSAHVAMSTSLYYSSEMLRSR